MEQFNTTDSNETTQAEGGANFFGGKPASITKKVRRKAKDAAPWIDKSKIVIVEGATAKRDDNGRLYVTDKMNMVRYYLEEGVVEVTEEHAERFAVATNNQRQFEMEEMVEMT